MAGQRVVLGTVFPLSSAGAKGKLPMMRDRTVNSQARSAPRAAPVVARALLGATVTALSVLAVLVAAGAVPALAAQHPGPPAAPAPTAPCGAEAATNTANSGSATTSARTGHGRSPPRPQAGGPASPPG